ncbi:putative ABC transporter permease [Mycoplasmatota bacterium]|nr:putative ABC transporter permease [Mycoplasmatota bacterium]
MTIIMLVKILFLFMIYALIGWIWETPYVSFNEKKYINRGFLRGPYIPIYGFACVTIILSMGIFDNMNDNSFITIICQILFISLVSAVWEYCTSYILEIIFKTRWWDYSKHKFNLNGRIALDYTILFGIGGYILWRFVNPFVENVYDLLPTNVLYFILYGFYFIFMIDNINTFRDMFKLRSIVDKLHFISNELSEKSDTAFEHIYTSIQRKKDGIGKELNYFKEKYEEKASKSLEHKIQQLNQLLKTSKNISRFFKKFPKTPSKSYEYILSIYRKNKNKK